MMKRKVLIPVLAATLCVSACNAQNNQTLMNSASSVLGVFGSAGGVQNASLASLSQTEIGQGLRQALTIGTQNVVGQLGVQNGFNADPNIRIPLPQNLQKLQSAMMMAGAGGLMSDLETRLNTAAEVATPKAKSLFINAISQMTITDAQSILTGPNNAATSYLRKTMGAELGTEMTPIIQNALAQAGAVQAYDQIVGRYANSPLLAGFVPDMKSELNSYVVDQALDGIFYYVAQEEAEIRENPAKRTTQILQKVFAGQ